MKWSVTSNTGSFLANLAFTRLGRIMVPSSKWFALLRNQCGKSLTWFAAGRFRGQRHGDQGLGGADAHIHDFVIEEFRQWSGQGQRLTLAGRFRRVCPNVRV